MTKRLIQINERLHVKVEFMRINAGVAHAGLAKSVGAGVVRNVRLGIQFRAGAKDFGRILHPDTRRLESSGIVRTNGRMALMFAAINRPH